MPHNKAQGQETASGAACDTTAACKLHAALARPGMDLKSKSYADNVMAALKQDVADGKRAAVNDPVPRLGYTVLQLAISSGAGQLVKRLLAEDIFDISLIDQVNLSNGDLPLLHEAVQSDSEDVLDAILEAPCAQDFTHQTVNVSVDNHSFIGVTPAVYLALLPVFCPHMSTDTDSCERRATMLGKLLKWLDTSGKDHGSHTFQVKDGATALSAVAVAALLCHAFPMQMVLSDLTMKFGPAMSKNEADAVAVAGAAKALEPICPGLMEKIKEDAASLVTSAMSVEAVPIPQAFWLSTSATLIANGKLPSDCGFDSSIYNNPSFMAVHMNTPPKGLEMTRMLPSQFCTFWASLNAEFAAAERSLELLKATGEKYGLEALYLARAIPKACPLREEWIKACVPPASVGHSLGSLLAASIHVPTPLKLNIMPTEFQRIWFPGCAVPEAAAEGEAASGDGDVVEEYRSEIWRKFMLGRDVPILSAVLAEGTP